MHEAFLFFYTLASNLDVHQPESGLPFDISRFARSYPMKQVSGTQGKTTSIIWLQISASFPFAIKPIGPHVTEKSMAACQWCILVLDCSFTCCCFCAQEAFLSYNKWHVNIILHFLSDCIRGLSEHHYAQVHADHALYIFCVIFTMRNVACFQQPHWGVSFVLNIRERKKQSASPLICHEIKCSLLFSRLLKPSKSPRLFWKEMIFKRN